MIERRIKELAIALEALSRIHGAPGYYDLDRLLQMLIKEAVDEEEAKKLPLAPAPKARTFSRPEHLLDDIPF